MKAMQSAARPSGGRLHPASGLHKGYDTLEFAPQECGRDFPRAAARRVRVKDEEQALLRRLAAGFSAPDVVRDPSDNSSEPDIPVDPGLPPGDGSSRLYRD